MGIYSVMFIIMYSKFPKETLEKINVNNIKDYFGEDFFNTNFFIRNEKIINDLQFLFKMKRNSWVDKYLVRKIFNSEKINVSKKDKIHQISKESEDLIVEKEWLIFKLFPEYLIRKE